MKKTAGYVIKKLEEEYVLLPTGELAEQVNEVISLSETAGFIYLHADQAASVEELADLVSREYGIKKEEVLEDRETMPLRWGGWMLLLCINTFAAMCSSLAAFLAALMIAAFGLVLSIQKRNLKLLFQLALSCVPCVFYMGLYIILR